MPLIGFRCPPNGEQPGRDNTYDYCLTQCQKRCMPKAMLYRFAEQHATNVHAGNMISPSALKGCTRKLVLERTSEYYEEPAKLYYAVRGSLIHGFLEDIKLPGIYTERRIYKTVETDGQSFVISGQLDYYDEWTRTIEDYKTASDKAFYYLFNDGARPEHVRQTNVYRWLADGGHLGALDGPVVHWPVDRIQIHYVLMNQVISTGQVHYERVSSYREPNSGKKYRLERRRRKVGKNGRGTPIWEIELVIPEVPLMSEAEIFAHLSTSGTTILQGFGSGAKGALPDGVLYNAKERWQCGYCGVKDACHAYEAKTNADAFAKQIADEQS